MNLQTTSLVVVDVQRGFTALCPDELPVPGGLEIVPAINQLLEIPWSRIDATQDWHPADHCSFFGQRDNRYPAHCVMNTAGAGFLPDLHTERFQSIWRKGFRRDHEAYAITAEQPAFVAMLRAAGVESVIVAGIALNICCFYTAKDLRAGGFAVVMARDASAGIDVAAAGLFQHAAEQEAMTLGIRYLTVEQILTDLRG